MRQVSFVRVLLAVGVNCEACLFVSVCLGGDACVRAYVRACEYVSAVVCLHVCMSVRFKIMPCLAGPGARARLYSRAGGNGKVV